LRLGIVPKNSRIEGGHPYFMEKGNGEPFGRIDELGLKKRYRRKTRPENSRGKGVIASKKRDSALIWEKKNSRVLTKGERP